MSKALELAKFGRETPPTGVVVGDSDAQTLSSKTFSDGPVFSGLNANGVPFLNASKVLSSSATFVFDGTNLGVGVASPGVKIDVQGASAGSTVARFASNDTNTTTALAVFQRNGGAVSAAVKYNATNSPLTIDFGTTTNHALTFITADTERMRISSDGLAVTGAISATGHFLGSHYFNSTDVSGMYVSSIANNHYVNSALIGSFSSSGLAVTGTLSAGNTTLTGTSALTVNRSGAQAQITLQNNGTSTGILIAGATNGLAFYDAAAGLPMGTWAYAAGLQVTGTISATGAISSSTGFSSYLAGGTNYVRLGTANYAFKFETPADNATLVIRRDDGNTGNIATFTLGGVAVTGSVTASATLLANNTSGTTQFRSGIGTDVSLATGEGLELLTTATTSTRVLSYSRTAGAFRTLDLAGSNVRMSPNNSTVGEFSSSGLTVTGTVTVNQNSTGVAAAFANSDTTNGYGVYIHAGGSSATRYALVVRDPAGNQDYFKISTVTGEVGHTIFRPGAYPSPEIARFTSTGLGIGTDNPTYKLHVNGTTYVNGTFIQSALANYTQQSISFSLNATGWVKLFTIDSPGGCRVRYRAGSQNSEEIGEFSVKATYVASGTQLTWSRQTYYHNINEIRVTGSNAGPYTVWVLVRTTDFAPTLMWQVLDVNSAATIHNVAETPAGSTISLTSPGYSSTNFNHDVTTSNNVGIGTINPTAKLHVKGLAGNAAPFINFETISPNSTFNWVSQAMASNLASGNNLVHFIGQDASTRNSGYIGYKHSSSSSTDNILTFGLYGVDNVLNINGAGKVGIGVQVPLHTLDVNGSLGVSELYGRTQRDTGGGNIDLTEYNANNFVILEVFGHINPNSGGSSYLDPIHMYVYVGRGWNGSALTSYIYVQHVAPPARDIYPSGGGMGNYIDAVWYNGTTETDTVNAGTTSYYVRLKAYNYNATYGSGFSVRVIRRA